MERISPTYKIPLSVPAVSSFTFSPAAKLQRQAGKLPDDMLFMSIKRNKKDFVLVRILDTSCFSIIRCLSIEDQLCQLEVRFMQNRYELEELRRKRKLRSEGLYAELEAVSSSEYVRYERLARRHLQKVFLQKA